MLKRLNKVPIVPSPSCSVDEEARTRFKHQSLMQDYEELFKETLAMKKKLQRTKEKKLKLLGEVQFLRRRYKYLLRNRSPNSPPERDLGRSQVSEIRSEILPKERSYREREATMQKPALVLDLNQISKGDESEEFQAAWGPPLRVEKKLKKSLIGSGGDEQPSDVKLSGCRGVGNGANRTGKRKISWQDQVALKV